jgi:hypothetical protein
MISPIALADSTGLGSLVGLIIVLSMMGIAYKLSGTMGALVTGILATFILTFIGMFPLWLGVGIGIGMIVGVLYKGEENGD